MAKDRLVSLRLTRRFMASSERVFDAWVSQEMAQQWLFTTPASQAHSTEIDARVGGAWRIVDVRDGIDYLARGEYLEIERPNLLVFTFGMPQFSEEVCRLSVKIDSDDPGCRVTLTQEPVTPDAASALEDGWSRTFDMLAAVAG